MLQCLKWVLYICAVGWIATIFLMLRLPPAAQIRPELHAAPVQTAVNIAPFSFDYKGQSIKVVPMAEYTLWGLVVSHNDPTDWYRFDITHNAQSPDTRDVCVIWGGNVKTDDYRKIHYHNNDWSCGWDYVPNVRPIAEYEISNNHLLTSDDAVRRAIVQVHIGDQIMIHGWLVNYSEQRWNGWFRNTSLSRYDTGNGACEIIFVDRLQVLASYNGLWARLHALCFYGFFASLALMVVLFFVF